MNARHPGIFPGAPVFSGHSAHGQRHVAGHRQLAVVVDLGGAGGNGLLHPLGSHLGVDLDEMCIRDRPMPPPWPSTTATSSSPRIILSIPPFSDLPFSIPIPPPLVNFFRSVHRALQSACAHPCIFPAWQLQWEAHHRVKKFLETLKKSGPQSRMIDVGRQKEVAARREQTDKRVLFPAGGPV